MQQRAVRVRVPPTFPATLSAKPYDVVNISITGALGRIDGAGPSVGSVHPFRIGVGEDAIDMNARVTRMHQVGDGSVVAIDFLYDLSPRARHQIGAVITHMIR